VLILILKKKRERKPKGQSRMDNRDTLAPPAQDVAIDKQNTKLQQRKPKRLATWTPPGYKCVLW